MTLSQRKIPILTGVNDVPSSTGQLHHPNSALLCKNYNDLIDNELNGLSDTIDLLSQGISNLSSNIQGINTAVQNQSGNITTLQENILALDSEQIAQSERIVNEIVPGLTDHNDRIVILESIVGNVFYQQIGGQRINNVQAYTMASNYTYNGTVLDNTHLLYPLIFKKRTRLSGYSYQVNTALAVGNAFSAQFYTSDEFGEPHDPILTSASSDEHPLSSVGVFYVDIPELAENVFERGEILWCLYKVIKPIAGNIAGNIVAMQQQGLPPLPNQSQVNATHLCYLTTENLDLTLNYPLEQVAFSGNSSLYPNFSFHTINV